MSRPWKTQRRYGRDLCRTATAMHAHHLDQHVKAPTLTNMIMGQGCVSGGEATEAVVD
jgi:hypothetical protein